MKTKPSDTPTDTYAACLDELNDYLRRHMLALNKKNTARKYGQAVADEVADRIAETRLENIADWLRREGWEALEANPKKIEKLEALLVDGPHAKDKWWEVYEREALQGGNLKDTEWWLNYGRRHDADTADMVLDDGGPVVLTFEDGTKVETVDRKATGYKALKVGLRTIQANQLHAIHQSAGKDGGHPNPRDSWLALLAGWWLKDRAEKENERLQRQANAVPFAIQSKAQTESGDQWTAYARPLDIPAALAGPMSVDLDGETYAHEPEMAAGTISHSLRPRGVDIVPAEWLENRNHGQLELALDANNPPEALREYMLETATKTAHLASLPNMCPKMLGFMFAAAPMSGRPVEGTLGELAQYLYPDWKQNRRSKRDLRGIGAAFVAIKGLRIIDKDDNGARRPYDLFTMDYALTDDPEARLGWMVNPWLVQRMKGGAGGGFFLLNMTRWLSLPISKPRVFPLYLRLAAMWDKCRQRGIYDPQRLRPIDADRLAFECNTLPPVAASYKQRQTDADSGKRQLKRARANLESDLEELTAAGLLGDWKPTKRKIYGQGFTFVPVPPDEYAEACKKAAQKVRQTQGKKARKPAASRRG